MTSSTPDELCQICRRNIEQPARGRRRRYCPPEERDCRKKAELEKRRADRRIRGLQREADELLMAITTSAAADIEVVLLLLDSFSPMSPSDAMGKTRARARTERTFDFPTLSFADWLDSQRGRTGAIGRFADSVASGNRTGHDAEVVDMAVAEWKSAQRADVIRRLEEMGITAKTCRSASRELRTVADDLELSGTRDKRALAARMRNTARKFDLAAMLMEGYRGER